RSSTRRVREQRQREREWQLTVAVADKAKAGGEQRPSDSANGQPTDALPRRQAASAGWCAVPWSARSRTRRFYCRRVPAIGPSTRIHPSRRCMVTTLSWWRGADDGRLSEKESGGASAAVMLLAGGWCVYVCVKKKGVKRDQIGPSDVEERSE